MPSTSSMPPSLMADLSAWCDPEPQNQRLGTKYHCGGRTRHHHGGRHRALGIVRFIQLWVVVVRTPCHMVLPLVWWSPPWSNPLHGVLSPLMSSILCPCRSWCPAPLVHHVLWCSALVSPACSATCKLPQQILDVLNAMHIGKKDYTNPDNATGKLHHRVA